jgi:tripartite-type tricarboxylate transporter receptor subunit TctC
VRIIVGFPAGSAGDLDARTVAARLSESLGQQFVIDNKPGASSSIAPEAALNPRFAGRKSSNEERRRTTKGR